MNFRAAATLSRGLLPAILLGTALAGCRSDAEHDAEQEAGGPDDSAPAIAPAVSVAPVRVDTPAPNPTNRATVAAPAPNAGLDATEAPEPTLGIVYHVVKGARFFDILVARIGDREHTVIGEIDDMCLDLPDQRDFDGDGGRDALVFRSPRCRGDAAPGLLFFVFADTTFRLSNPFPGHRPRVERWNGEWSVLASGTRHVLRDGRAVRVDGVGSPGPP